MLVNPRDERVQVGTHGKEECLPDAAQEEVCRGAPPPKPGGEVGQRVLLSTRIGARLKVPPLVGGLKKGRRLL